MAPRRSEFGFALPRTTAAQRDRALALLAALRAAYPNARCELDHSAPHELLAATILSAQATDVSVNKATPGLFKAFPTPADYARATPEQIEPYIRTIGLYRSKAKSLHATMTAIVERFGGQIPRTMDELLTLRGVARKTAGVVLGNCFGINVGVVVDTHVHRLSRRLGLAPADTNVQNTERRLMALFPRDAWCELSHLLIFHGRYTCTARGKCCPQEGPGTAICQTFGKSCELRVSARKADKAAPRAARQRGPR